MGWEKRTNSSKSTILTEGVVSLLATFISNLVKKNPSFRTSVVHKKTLVNDNTVMLNRNQTTECNTVPGTVCVCKCVYICVCVLYIYILEWNNFTVIK